MPVPTVKRVYLGGAGTGTGGEWIIDDWVYVNVQFENLQDYKPSGQRLVVDTTGGTPRINLGAIGSDGSVKYAVWQGDDGDTLRFVYVPRPGDAIDVTLNATKLQYNGVNALELNGGTIRGRKSDNSQGPDDNVNDDFPALSSSNSLAGQQSNNFVMETTRPTITSITVSTNGATSSLAKEGNTLTFTVGFSEEVTISDENDVKVPFKIGTSATQYAIAEVTSSRAQGGTANAIDFTYTVPSNLNGNVALTGSHLALHNSATVKDTAGNDLATDLPGSLSGSVTVDTTEPTVQSVVLSDDNLTATVTFSENVYTATGGSGDLQPSDFDLGFTYSGGGANVLPRKFAGHTIKYK